MSRTFWRILVAFALFLCVVWAPFWLTVSLGAIFFLFFRNYWEFPIVLLFVFLIYLPHPAQSDKFWIFAFLALVIFFIAEEIKKQFWVRFRNKK